MRKSLIVANWKCNPTTLAEARQLFDSVKKGIKNACPEWNRRVEVVICPPFVYLSIIQQLNNQTIRLGAQDCFWDSPGGGPPAGGGAFTGEISPKQLLDLGCEYVILGHSERRKYFNETNEMINKKMKAALSVKLKPILCVGETEKERKKGKTSEIIKRQIKKALNYLSAQSLRNIIIAYEPIWAIGTGKACSAKEAKIVNLFIKKIVKNTPILYGGSVNSKNALEYLDKSEFQGLLVGGASLNTSEFIKIVKIASPPKF